MGIDRIAGHPATPPLEETAGAARGAPAAAPGQRFEAPRPEAAAPASPAPPVDGASPLDALRGGRIDLDGYIDAKVDQATSHLAALPAAQLQAIREALRDRLANDPSLVDLVQAATGEVPRPRDD